MQTPENWLRTLCSLSNKARSLPACSRRLLQNAFPYVLLLNMRMVATRRSEFFWARQVVRKWLNIRSSGDEFNADGPEEGDESDEDEKGDYFECPDVEQSLVRARSEVSILEETTPEKLERPQNNGLHRWQSEPISSDMLRSQEYRMSVGTWNVAGKLPPDGLEIEEWLDTSEPADIYVLGFQEVVPLNAGNVLGAEDDGPAVKWDALIRQTLNKKFTPTKPKSYSTPASPTRTDVTDVVSRLQSIVEGVVHKDESSALLETEGNRNQGPETRSNHEVQKEQVNSRRKNREYSRTWSSFRLPADSVDLGSNKVMRTVSARDENVFTTEETVVSPVSSPLHSRGASATKSTYLRQGYSRVASKQMVGIFISVWVRTSLRRYVHNIKVSCVGLGIMGYLGNKGSVSISMSLQQTSFCFVCSHLTSGNKEGDELRRNSDVAEILKRTHFPRTAKSIRQDLPDTILAHDRIIWLGDLNYRLTSSHSETRKLVAREQWENLLSKDQLMLEQAAGRVFDGWREGIIYFAPTYKYVLDSDQYFGEVQKPGEKQRAPAWCDRILWYGKGLRLLSYVRTESRLSDHRPVSAVFFAEVEFDSRKFKKTLTSPDVEGILQRGRDLQRSLR